MRGALASALACLLLCVGLLNSFGATNVQHIQTWAGADPGTALTDTILANGQLGVGSWGYTGTASAPYDYLKIGTNYPYRLPNWLTYEGTNYDKVFTNWVYYTPSVAGQWEAAQLTLPGAQWGPQSNLWVGFYFSSTVSNRAGDVNFDPIHLYGNGGYCVLQYATRSSGTNFLYAHGQGGSNGYPIPYRPDGKVVWITVERNVHTGCCNVSVYDATNNFRLITNTGGGSFSQGAFTPGTNTGRFWLQANYLLLHEDISGTNWFSSLFFGWGGPTTGAPSPETNAIVSDRTVPLEVGSTLGIRGSRPARTLETNVSFYGASTSSDDNTSAINTAISTAASNTVVLFDQIYKIRGTVTQNKNGVTVRGTNGGGILLGAGGVFNRGPTALSAGQAKVFWATNGIRKGATNATLTTNYSALAGGGVIAPLQAYNLSQMDGRNPQNRNFTTDGSERNTSLQDIVILTTNGNTITFWPPAAEDFTNAPALVQRFTTIAQAMGMEGITITTTNGGVYETNAGSQNLRWQGELDGWVTSSRILYANNYAVDINYLINCEFNSNTVRYGSVRAGSHGGLQITGGSGLYTYDNIIADHSDRGIQINGGLRASEFGWNYITNSSGQSVRYHAPGNDDVIFEGNIFEGYIQQDGYRGSNKRLVAFRNQVQQFDYRRFSTFGTMLGNVNVYPYQTGFPNLGNNSTNGLSKYTEVGLVTTFLQGMPFNYPQTHFTGQFGTAPYLGRVNTNVFHIFTNVSLEVINGTNLQGNFTNFSYSASGGYSLHLQAAHDTNIYVRYADFTNSPTEHASVVLQAHELPTETNMVLNRYIPITNGMRLLPAGADLYQQRQTIENGTFLDTYAVIGGVRTDDPTHLPRALPTSILYAAKPAWIGTNEWPTVDIARATQVEPNPAKTRFLAGDSSEEGGGEGPGPVGFSRAKGRFKITGQFRMK